VLWAWEVNCRTVGVRDGGGMQTSWPGFYGSAVQLLSFGLEMRAVGGGGGVHFAQYAVIFTFLYTVLLI
jgi:hypothetical protein